MNIVINGDISKFKSLKEKSEFEKDLKSCKTEEDFKQIKADKYIKKGFAFTMKKTTQKLIINIITEKDAKRQELRMKLRNKINQKKNGNQKMKQKRGNELSDSVHTSG